MLWWQQNGLSRQVRDWEQHPQNSKSSQPTGVEPLCCAGPSCLMKQTDLQTPRNTIPSLLRHPLSSSTWNPTVFVIHRIFKQNSALVVWKLCTNGGKWTAPRRKDLWKQRIIWWLGVGHARAEQLFKLCSCSSSSWPELWCHLPAHYLPSIFSPNLEAAWVQKASKIPCYSEKSPFEQLDLLEIGWEEKSPCWKLTAENTEKHDQKKLLKEGQR